MAIENIDLRNELRAHKFEFNLLQKILCSKQENKEYQKILKDCNSLSDDVSAYIYDSGETSTFEFYIIYETDLSKLEIAEYLIYKKLNLLKTIKNYIMFFTIITTIGMIAYLFMALSVM